MGKIVAVMLGGSLGSLLRYLISGLVQSRAEGIFPYGTLAVNMVGCFLIGFLWTLFETTTVRPETRVFFITGILGGFTTFSAFGLETFNLVRDNEFFGAFANFAVTNLLGLICVFAGVAVSRMLLHLFRGMI